jgi:hypothetical protein
MPVVAQQSYVEQLERQIAEELVVVCEEIKRLRAVVKKQGAEIDYLKRLSRAPGARRSA